jgi:DNA-binding beta-propeller fold protein YncE
MPNLLYSLDGNLVIPQGVAVSNNVLAVADTGNNQVAVYAIAMLPGGQPIRIGASGTNPAVEGLKLPGALTFVAPDEIIIADTQNQQLDRYKYLGGAWTFQNSVWQFPGIVPSVGSIVDLTLDGGGELLFLDATHRRILRLTIATGTIALHYSDPTWVDPSGLAVGGGYLWVTDAGSHQVFRYDAAFTRMSIGGYGTAAGKLRAPHGMLVDGISGKLYVSEAGGARISIFDLAGQHQAVIPLPLGSPHELHKMALDLGANRLYVADAGASRVHVFDLGAASLPLSVDQEIVDFGMVGIGYRLRLPITVQNRSNTPVQFVAATVQGVGFSLDPASSTFPLTIPAGTDRQLWLRFTPTTEGSVFGRLHLATDITAQPALYADLVGEGLVTEPMSVALVLDRSGSMLLSSGALSKIDRLRATCELLIDALSLSGSDELALVTFSSNATVNFARTSLSSGAVTTAKNAVAAISAQGVTSIGAGLQLAFGQIATTNLNRRNIIALTDGQENTNPRIRDVPVPNGLNIFTIGIGLPQYLDVAILESLASKTGGYFQMTDGNDYLLSKFLVQIFSDLSRQQVAVDPPVTFRGGQIQDFPVDITSGDIELSVFLTWERIGCDFVVELISPNGAIYDRTYFGWEVIGNRHLALRMPMRGSRWEMPGRWIVRIHPVRTVAATENGVLTVLVASDHHLDWGFSALTPDQLEFDPPTEAEPYGDTTQIPPTGRYPSPPSELRRGDRVLLEVHPAVPIADVTILKGTLEFHAPETSLAALRLQYEHIDLDHLNEAPIKFQHRIKWNRTRFTVDKKHLSATIEIPLDGPDGIYYGRARIHAMTSDGEVFQRERSFSFLVLP